MPTIDEIYCKFEFVAEAYETANCLLGFAPLQILENYYQSLMRAS